MVLGNDATKALFLFIMLALLVPATDAQKNNKTDVTISVRSELVTIPVVVTDKSGAAIGRLTKNDFVVLENNQQRPITVFEEVVTGTERVTRLSAPGGTTTFTNILQGNDSQRRVTAIVLDLLNTEFTDQARGRQQLLKYLAEAVDSREPTALFVLTSSGVRVIHDFTTDPEILAKALHQLALSPEPFVRQDSGAAAEKVPGAFYKGEDNENIRAIKGQMADALREVELHFTGAQTRVAAIITMEGLQQIAHSLEGIPGRKALIWASGGFPFSIGDTYNQTQFWHSDEGITRNERESVTGMLPVYSATWRALNQAQISVYPVDVRGIVNEQYVHPSMQHPDRDYTVMKDWQQNELLATFNNFADMTGGRAYYNSNDLVQGFRDAVNDSSHYYMLGYYLTRNDRVPGWQKLEVKVKRADAKVRARSGFLITKATADGARLEETDIQNALTSPLDFTAIPFRMQWMNRSYVAPGTTKVTYGISIAPKEITIDEADGNHLALEVIAVAKSPDGKIIGKPQVQKLEAHLRPEMAQQIEAKGIEYGGELELDPGEYNVRILVRDELTGKMGSVAARLTIESVGPATKAATAK
jgi:VWFA-related protein